MAARGPADPKSTWRRIQGAQTLGVVAVAASPWSSLPLALIFSQHRSEEAGS